MRLLARFGTDEDYKIRYMSIVEGFETEEQIMPNRIRLRRYLRELMINQKRVLQAALDKDYVEQVKAYFDQKRAEEEEKAKAKAEAEKKKQEEEEEEDEYDEEEEEDEIEDK